MSDVERLLDQVAPAPWHYFSDGQIFGNDGDSIAACDGNAAHLVDPAHRAEVIVYAVNRLPDYEAAAEALAQLIRWWDGGGVANGQEWTDAREALRRLRGES